MLIWVYECLGQNKKAPVDRVENIEGRNKTATVLQTTYSNHLIERNLSVLIKNVIDYKLALLLVMAWYQSSDKPLPELTNVR